MKWAPWMLVAVGLSSAGPVQAQSIECTFLNKEDKTSPLFRWTVNLGPKPTVHHWHAVTSYHNGSDAEREVAYVKHAGATNTAVVVVKSNYESDVQASRSGQFDFDDIVILIDFAKNLMAVTVAGQAVGPTPVDPMDTCRRLD